MHLRLLLALLILATATARAGAPRFDVTSYDVQITPDFDSKSISGTERIRFISLADGLDTIDFSANTLTVWPARASFAPIQPPMAPAPTMQTFIRNLPTIYLDS